MDIILKYFPNLSIDQQDKFGRLLELYSLWNDQINVISRKDLDSFYERHVLHSLGIAKVIQFLPQSRVLDIGTGGGFPGIPLAILFPEVQFHLVDSIGKKIKVVNEVAKALDLSNVKATHARAEDINDQYDFIVSRAVTAMSSFIPWTKGKISSGNKHNFANGIFYLKGGDLTEELAPVKQPIQLFELHTFFEEEFFDTKKVVYVQLN
jgi:16S rRNA (guanine527-N7)-methyltransferase